MKMTKQTLMQHLDELRKRVLYILLFLLGAFIIAYIFKTQILEFLFLPLSKVNTDLTLIYTNIPDLFMFFITTSLKLAFIATIPFLIIQAWAFVKPALKKNEKNSIFPILFLAPFLFLCGIVFCYFLIMPIVIEFFTTYNSQVSTPEITISLFQNINEYFSFFLMILLGFGAAFELPIVLWLLVKLGIVTKAKLKKFRRYFIVLAVFIAAILTPPDVLSQLLMSIPLIALYEITLLFIKDK